MAYDSIGDMIALAAEGVRPAERLSVSQAAERYRFLNNRGSYVGPWKNETTPYLVEPMDVLTRLKYTGMIFVGPAQCGKTDMYVNWHTYTVICDPADMMLVQTSQTTAADFSRRRVDRLHRDSPEVGRRLLPSKQADNTFDKRYRSGALITLSWPTINELSGKPIPRLYLTDYDRMDQDIDGNGSPFDLAAARTTTFGRHGMTAAESSPSFPVLDPRWSPSTRHEAPPTEGILALYNRGDRRRWYWRCADCDTPFEPDFSLLRWDPGEDAHKSAETVRLECPHCGAAYREGGGNGRPGKREMNKRGRWLRDGQRWPSGQEPEKEGRDSDIASFWLKGPAATFKAWRTLVIKFLQAEDEYARTGSEDALKATINVDQGLPYLPKSLASDRVPEKLKERARDYGYKVVPVGVRFLVAAIDVQKNRFVVQVHGVGQGGDLWVVDRFDIRYSQRDADDREGQKEWVRPFVYAADWHLILREVMAKTYPLGDDSGREMGIKLTVSDSGAGDEGTSNAYAFYRWLKNGPEPEDRDDWPEWVPGIHARFQLLKGASTKGVPRTRITYPDSGRKDRAAGARGEIPVMMVNTTAVKNLLDGVLEREKEHSGRVRFPSWLDINFYKELCVETKDIRGNWVNPKGFRNESWDLFVYCLSGLIENRHIGIERLDWTDPPLWAAEWDINDLVFNPNTAENPVAATRPSRYDLSKLGATLG